MLQICSWQSKYYIIHDYTNKFFQRITIKCLNKGYHALNHVHINFCCQNESIHPMNFNKAKTPVSTNDDNNSSTNKNVSSRHRSHKSHQKHRKSATRNKNDNETTITKEIYASPDTVIGSDTIKDLCEAVNSQNSVSSQSTALTERVIIIDRPDAHQNIRTNTAEPLQTYQYPVSTLPVMSNMPSVYPNQYGVQQPVYWTTSPWQYQRPPINMPLPKILKLTALSDPIL